jgi:hypothetical protein
MRNQCYLSSLIHPYLIVLGQDAMQAVAVELLLLKGIIPSCVSAPRKKKLVSRRIDNDNQKARHLLFFSKLPVYTPFIG